MTNEDLAAMTEEVLAEFPAMRKIPFEVGRAVGKGKVEAYPEFESRSPRRGKNFIEFRSDTEKSPRNEVKSMLAGEVLHFLGGLDIEGKPVNPAFRKFKDEFRQSLTAEQLAFEKQFHKKLQDAGEEDRPFDDFMEYSRTDAYIRGFLFPDKDAEFLDPGVLTNQQKRLLERARTFLKTESP